MARVALIADVPVDIWAVPAWAHVGTPSNPHETKTRNVEALAKKPPTFRQRRQAKGDAALIPALPAVKPPAVKQSATKAASASAQELAPRVSMLAHSSTMLTLVKS
mgnify:CR=1 FL=1